MSSYEFLTKVINPAREEAGENPVSNKDFINRVKDELDLKEENFLLLDTGASGRKSSHTILNGDQLLLVGMRESKAVRRKVLDYIRRIEKDKQLLEDQKKRAAIQSANRRGVTWGDYCKTYGLPAQKLMTALLQHRGLFRKNPISNEWSVNPKYSDCFRIIKPSDQKFSAGGYNFRFNAKGLEVFGKPEMVDKMRGILIAFTGTDQQKQEHLLKQAQSGKLEGL
ncbi:phage-encoded protein [Enterobacter hormaechei subsp. xiangfangensis]|nr:phage-encoded protein [Enterobacter hormaechei subsp. xiangfangensis]